MRESRDGCKRISPGGQASASLVKIAGLLLNESEDTVSINVERGDFLLVVTKSSKRAQKLNAASFCSKSLGRSR